MKEIKKKIDVNSLVPAPLDNKNVMLDWWKENMFDDENYSFNGNVYLGFIAGVSVIAIIKNNIVKIKCIPQSYKSTDKLDDFGNAVIKNLTEYECHLTTYMVPSYKQYIDDEHYGNTKLLISFSIYEDEATISFHWNVPKD